MYETLFLFLVIRFMNVQTFSHFFFAFFKKIIQHKQLFFLATFDNLTKKLF